MGRRKEGRWWPSIATKRLARNKQHSTPDCHLLTLSSIPPFFSLMPLDEMEIEAFLQSLDLAVLIPIFKEQQIDMTALREMGVEEMKELNLPMGPRLKLQKQLEIMKSGGVTLLVFLRMYFIV